MPLGNIFLGENIDRKIEKYDFYEAKKYTTKKNQSEKKNDQKKSVKKMEFHNFRRKMFFRKKSENKKINIFFENEKKISQKWIMFCVI